MKKIISLILTAVMVLTMTTSAFAAGEVKSFYDVSSTRWSFGAIMDMVDLGMFKGKTTPDKYGAAYFDPAGTMTMAEFTAVMLRYAYPEETAAAEEGQYWYSKYYDLAVEKGLFDENKFSIKDMDHSVTRQTMAIIVVNTAKALGEDTDVDVKDSAIADYGTISDYFRPYVKSAFGMGLITGMDSKGTFAPYDSLTREQGAMVAYRLVYEDERKYPSYGGVEIILPTDPADGAMTIYEGQMTMRPAREGDVFVKADGTRVVLKNGPTGVLGEGQGVAPDKNLRGTWTGTRYNYIMGEGTRFYSSLGNGLNNSSYYINLTTGEGHWHDEWSAICDANPAPKADGTYNGQVSADSIWRWSSILDQWLTNTAR